MRTYAHVTSLVLALVACEPVGRPATAPEPRPPRAHVSPATLARDADRRVVTETLRTAALAPETPTRRTAAVALARVRSPEAVELSIRALRDTDPEVRRAASLGLGGLEDAGPEVATALARALASEPEPSVRADMVVDLARLRQPQALPAIEAAVRSEAAPERAGGCRAAAERGLAGLDVPATTRTRIAALLAAEQPPEVRLACAYALARLPAPTDPTLAQAEHVALTMAAADPDPEVRAYAYRALGRQPEAALETLAHGTRDTNWRVAVQAFRALAARATAAERGSSVYAGALEGAYRRALEAGLTGGPLHVLVTALEAAAPLARSTPVHDVGVRVHRALGELPPGTAPTRDRGLAHCAAAELVDRGRGWPSRVEACGLEQVLPPERDARAAGILGDLDGAEEQRVAFLERLYRDESPVMKEAVVAAAALIWHPGATDLVLRALREGDPGVVAAAAEALTRIARRGPTETRVPPPLPVERAVAALRAAGEALSDQELESLVTWLGAVEAVDARSLLPRVRALAAHPSTAVQRRAREVLAHWEEPQPSEPVPEPPNVIDVEQIPDPASRPRVILDTDRGRVVIELRPDVAPVTVARFVGLVRDRFYDGLTFHRVVPGFVAQGGDPRGDGYGGPGFWLRCEESRLPYVRGTVGMALAGRDTGGSQFFLTLSAQPHLEGRYTAFGTVVEGLDRLDLLQPGDRIRSATVAD